MATRTPTDAQQSVGTKDRNASRKWMLVVLMACWLLGMARVGVAQDFIAWQAGTGDWFTASNWINYSRPDGHGGYLNSVPGSLDLVSVTNGGSSQISNGTASAAYLNIDFGSSLGLFGGSLNITESVEIIGGTGLGFFTHSGGTNHVSDYLKIGVDPLSDGTYWLSNTAYLSTAGEVVGENGNGTFNQSGGTHIITTGDLLLGECSSGVGHFNLSGGSVVVASVEIVGYAGSGSWIQTGGTNTVTGPVAVAVVAGSTGTFNLQGGTLTAGSMLINLGGTFTNEASVSLHGTTYTGSSTGGVYTQTAGGSLSILIEGADPTQYGRIIVGQANLGGTLNVTLAPGYVPDVGSTYDIITGAASGTFSQVSLPGPEWVIQYLPDRVTVGPDTDGDGILDGWELNGIPYLDANNQQQRYPLPGANRLRKDIYVEVDSMDGFSPPDTALDDVVQAFARSPVHNLYGGVDYGDGVTLHIMKEKAHQHINPTPFAADDPWPEFYAIKTSHFGSVQDQNPRNTERLNAQAKAVRYCLFAHSFGGTRHTGRARGMPSNDFMVTFGNITLPLTDELVAGTFMHELGHTLGLGHGGRDGSGSDDKNYKPNYYSVMNWWWQFPDQYTYQGGQEYWRLDYSHEPLPTLIENTLSEQTGIGAAVGLYPGLQLPYTVNVSGDVRFARLRGSVNWNGIGGINTGTVTVNLNNRSDDPSPSDQETLLGREDWTVLQYPLVITPVYDAPGAAGRDPGNEIDEQTILALRAIPAPPPACPADFNTDGFVNSQDFFDFLAAFFAIQPAADFNHDAFINSQDFFDFLAAFFTGC